MDTTEEFLIKPQDDSNSTKSVKSRKEPLISRFLTLFHNNRRAFVDLFFLILFSVVTFLVLIEIEFTEFFFEISRQSETYELDEIIFSLLVVMAFYFPIFAVLRWRESVTRLKLANTDSLTGLFNHRKGWEILEVEISRAQRYNHHLSIILFDIDRFKWLNDQYGHLTGDRILKHMACIVEENLRNIDSLVRLGGEEFMVITIETDLNSACKIAERLRVNIEQGSFENYAHVTASFGVAQLTDEDHIDSFFRRADEKLYEAKAAGRNRVAPCLSQ